MAGDWIPIGTDLPYKPEVARIAEAIRRSPDEVVGILVRFWSWAQAHCSHGVFPGYTPDTLAKVARVSTSFLRAMVSVGWLDVTENGTVIPKFDRWLSDGAKRRLMNTERVRRFRAEQRKEVSSERNAECNARVTQQALQMCYPLNNDDVDDVRNIQGEKGGVGEKGEAPGSSAICPDKRQTPEIWELFRTYATAWGPRGPTTKRDRTLLWRVCRLAVEGHSWAKAALESLENGNPSRPGAYLQKVILELGPRNPHVSLILAELPVPPEIQHPPGHTSRAKPPQPAVQERPLTPEEGRELVQELFAAVSRSPVRRP